MLTSCSISNVDEEQVFDFEILPIEQVYEASNQMNLIEKSPISTLSEEKLKEILEPFILNGKSIYDSIKQADEVDKFISSGEFDNSNLDDSFYAQLSFTYAVIAYELQNENFTTAKKSIFSSNITEVDFKLITECASEAVGIAALRKVGLSGLMTAKGAVEIIKVVAKRQAAFIGAAYSLYKFADCMGAFE